MQYDTWFHSTIKKISPTSPLLLYAHTLVFGLLFFAIFYVYNAALGASGLLNKAVADTAVILIGLSMALSGLCYFWDIFDTKIIYRKYLGLMGYAFTLVHVLLSTRAFAKFLDPVAWETGSVLPVIEATMATAIFTIMALISNAYSAKELGGVTWRRILRTGYIALIFVLMHVALLKAKHWMEWWQSGFGAPPIASLMVSIFILLVLLLRIALWASLLMKKNQPEITT